MTTTEHYQLNTWAQEDFVSLTQMNENFTKVDAALHGRKLAGDQLHAENKRTACNQAQALLAAAKEGAHYGELENVLLSAFLDGADLNSYMDLVCRGDLRKALTQGSAPTEMKADTTNWPKTPVAPLFYVGKWTFDGWCNCTLRPRVQSPNLGGTTGTYTFYLKKNGEILKQSNHSFAAYTQIGPTWELTNVDPTYPLELWIEISLKGTNSCPYQDIHMGTGTTTAISSGNMTAVTKTATITGQEARVNLRYTGTAPSLAYRLGSGAAAAAPAPVVKDSVGHDGWGCKLAVYDIDFGSAQNGVDLALHITIGEDTVVKDFCAAVV